MKKCAIIAGHLPMAMCKSDIQRQTPTAIIIINSGDDVAMEAAKKHIRESGYNMPILVMEPEHASQIRLIERYGRKPALSIENGQIKIKIQKATPAKAIGGLSDAFSKLLEEQKKLNDSIIISTKPTERTSSIHPKFQSKYKPVENMMNTNKPRKKTKRKK